jgi:hypothetical protein
MPNVLLTDDVRRTTATIHTEVKNTLINNYGYHPTLLVDNTTPYYLPNTTLAKANTTRGQSAEDFLHACANVGAIWERYVTSEFAAASIDNQNP